MSARVSRSAWVEFSVRKTAARFPERTNVGAKKGHGFGAPRATPPAIIARLNREIRAVLADTELRKRLVELGGDVRPNSPEDMRRHVAADIAKWQRIVETRKIQIE